ncbi:MAG: hypothetical protein ABR583_06850 [Gaiellaceae bacterium]
MHRFPAVLVVIAALAFAPAAAATHTPGHPPTGASAFDQYVEQIPSSSGSTVPGTGSGKRRPLAPGVAAELRSLGLEGALLESIATDPSLGAPERTSRADARTRRLLRERADDDSGASAAFSAAVSAAGDGSAGRLVALVVVLGGVTMLLGGLALRQRRMSAG